MKMSPENRGFRDSCHWRCGTPRLQSGLEVAQKSAARLDRELPSHVPSRVIAAESWACFAAHPLNRFIDRFVWRPVVFVARFGVNRRAKVENRHAGCSRNDLRGKWNYYKIPL